MNLSTKMLCIASVRLSCIAAKCTPAGIMLHLCWAVTESGCSTMTEILRNVCPMNRDICKLTQGIISMSACRRGAPIRTLLLRRLRHRLLTLRLWHLQQLLQLAARLGGPVGRDFFIFQVVFSKLWNLASSLQCFYLQHPCVAGCPVNA